MRARSPLYLAWIAFISGRCSCIRCIEWICRTVRGTRSIRTMIVSATIDHAQVRPNVVCSPSSAQVRTSSIGERMLRKPIIGTAVGPRPCPRRRGSRGYSGEAASRQGSSRVRARTGAGRRGRTASTTGGTCTSPGRALPACSGRRTHLRSRRTSRACLAENFLETLAHPFGAAALLGLAEGGPNEQDVVRPWRHVGDELAPALAKATLDPVAGHRAPDLLGDRDPEAHVALLVILSIEPVEDEVGGRPVGAGQYRETISYQFFHSLDGQHVRWKRPASHAFSPVNTARVRTLSTSVERAGDELKIPVNPPVFGLSAGRVRPLNPLLHTAMLAPSGSARRNDQPAWKDSSC